MFQKKDLDIYYCQQCGKVLALEDKYCSFCGYEKVSAENPSYTAKEMKILIKRLVFLCGTIFIVLGTILYILHLMID